jgi:hypothetical protein
MERADYSSTETKALKKEENLNIFKNDLATLQIIDFID